MPIRQTATNPVVVALGIVLVTIGGVLAWLRFAPYGMSSEAAEATVAQLRGTSAEYFYLGEEAAGLRLANIVDPEDGRLIFEYGRCMDHDEGGCNRPLVVISTPRPDLIRGDAVGGDCLTVLQVLGEGQIIDISASEVEIDYVKTIPDGYMTDFGRSKALVPQLRKVGQSAPAICGQQAP